MSIGRTIRARRKQLGLTQRELGARCGLSGAAIGSYESGHTRPRRRAMERIARALDLPADRLMDPPAPAAPAASDGHEPLYDGVLAALRELYGGLEGRMVLAEDGSSRRYYIVDSGEERFVLWDRDVAAMARSAGASLAPLMERLAR